MKGHRALECVNSRTGVATPLFVPVPTYPLVSSAVSSWFTMEVTIQFVYFSKLTSLSASDIRTDRSVVQHIIRSLAAT